MRQLESVVANHPSGFFDLAAAPRQPLDAMPTSPRKTRVRGFRRHASGRLSSRGLCRSINTPGSRACGYKTMSGRHEWLNRDPKQETGGINLYEFVGNEPVDKIDPSGLSWVDFIPLSGYFSTPVGANIADYAGVPNPSCKECKDDPEGAVLKCVKAIALLQA